MAEFDAAKLEEARAEAYRQAKEELRKAPWFAALVAARAAAERVVLRATAQNSALQRLGRPARTYEPAFRVIPPLSVIEQALSEAAAEILNAEAEAFEEARESAQPPDAAA